MKLSRKGQTAMEYLMTYGWAIIIVVIIGIALWKLGIFTPSITASTGFEEFSVADYEVTTAGVASVPITNMDKQSRSVKVNNATVDGQVCTGVGTVTAGNKLTLSCSGITTGATGTPYTLDVKIGYTVAGSDLTEVGKITGKYK